MFPHEKDRNKAYFPSYFSGLKEGGTKGYVPFSSTSKNEEKNSLGASVVVQWLRFRASNAEDMGVTPGHGTKTPYANRAAQLNFPKTSHRKHILTFTTLHLHNS